MAIVGRAVKPRVIRTLLVERGKEAIQHHETQPSEDTLLTLVLFGHALEQLDRGHKNTPSDEWVDGLKRLDPSYEKLHALHSNNQEAQHKLLDAMLNRLEPEEIAHPYQGIDFAACVAAGLVKLRSNDA